MNPLRNAISRILNLVLEPLLCRMEDRLRPIHAGLHDRLVTRIDALERALAPPFLATLIKNEMQNLDSLPLPLLENMKDLTIVGYCADDLASVLPGCRVATVTDWLGSVAPVLMELPVGNLLFLDEYYFTRTMERMASLTFPLAESIVVATRFDYLSEIRCRSALHQIGFMEIVLVSVDSLTGDLATFAVSHASPVTCDPLFVDERRPQTGPGGPSIWLVARKVAWHGAEAWPHA